MSNPYLHANYYIDRFINPILIGQLSDELESYLEAENVRTWAFITAYNPMSKVLSPEENELRNQDLLDNIKGYHYLTGEGRDPLGEWIPERSFLILDISRKDAIDLAFTYDQKAILYGEKGKIAELTMLEY